MGVIGCSAKCFYNVVVSYIDLELFVYAYSKQRARQKIIKFALEMRVWCYKNVLNDDGIVLIEGGET